MGKTFTMAQFTKILVIGSICEYIIKIRED